MISGGLSDCHTLYLALTVCILVSIPFIADVWDRFWEWLGH